MKKQFMLLLIGAGLTLAWSNASAQEYIDLATGKKVKLVKNEANGIMYNPESQRPVFIYVDPTTNDTLYGRTGANINGQVKRRTNGQYFYNGDAQYVFKNGDYQVRTEEDSYGDNYKKKVQSDGDMKVKDGDFKKKVGANGFEKRKNVGTKVKAEGDGGVKVKEGDYKFRKKLDADGNEKVKDSTFKAKEKNDGSVKVKDYEGDYKGKVDENGNVKEKDAADKTKSKKGKTKVKAKQ